MPHTFRTLPGPSLWPLPGQLTQLVHAALTASPHKAWGFQKIALLPIKEKSGRASCSVGLRAGLMRSGHKVRSLPELERLLAWSLIQCVMGWSAPTATSFPASPCSTLALHEAEALPVGSMAQILAIVGRGQHRSSKGY